jgi:Flp pilus assembly protein CpaB
VSRFAVVDRLREQWLACAGLTLAVLALVLSLLPGGGEPVTAVLALRHALPAGTIVRESDVVAVPISASDRTPSMLSRLGALEGRRTLIGLAGGDFVLRGALRPKLPASLLRPGERAVALQLPAGAAPDSRLLQRGRVVDVVVLGDDGARVVARGLQLLSAAVERPGGVSVTLRAPPAVALALTGGRPGGELRLLLRGGRG